MIKSIIQPKKPSGSGWHLEQIPIDLDNLGYPWTMYSHPETGLTVISAVEVTETEPGAEALGPEYHLSISKRGQRCTSQEAKWVLRQFELEDAEEDNYVPSGKVRNFWRPVADRLSGYQCPCKASEPAITEDKGDYVWRGVL